MYPNVIKMQSPDNENLVWITEVKDGKKTERTEETTEVITGTDTEEIGTEGLEQLITQTIVRTIRKKTLSTLNNTTTP